MAKAIKMPDLGTTVDQITLLQWKVCEGDAIKRGAPLADIETDKATNELESVAEGTVLQLLARDGDIIAVGQVIAYIGQAGEHVPDTDTPVTAPPTTPPKAPAMTRKPAAGRPRVAPMVRNLAEQKDIDLSALQGTGPHGTVTRQDVLAAAEKPTVSSAAPAPSPQGAPNDQELLEIYRQMLLIRKVEQRLNHLFLEGTIPGTLHQSLGQEAVAVGVCRALRREDMITSTHRPHAHALAKGVSLPSFIGELLGKGSGCCKGRGGSMHVGDLSEGMVPSIAIVGGGIPIATGIALAFKQRNEDRVAIAFTGDGGVAEGVFHEAVNMAAIWNLPVLYVIENNCYAASTHFSRNTKLKQLSGLAAAYDIPGTTIDGNDVLAVYHTATAAVERARTGEGPTIIEAMTYRITGHNRRDPCNYMPEDDRQQAAENEPVQRFEKFLLNSGHADGATLAKLDTDLEAKIDVAIESALAEPAPEPEEAFKYVYAERGSA